MARSSIPVGRESGSENVVLGRRSPAKWQMSPPRSMNLAGWLVVRASPHMCPTAWPGVSGRQKELSSKRSCERKPPIVNPWAHGGAKHRSSTPRLAKSEASSGEEWFSG